MIKTFAYPIFALAAYYGTHHALVKISSEFDTAFTELATDFDLDVVKKESAFQSK